MSKEPTKESEKAFIKMFNKKIESSQKAETEPIREDSPVKRGRPKVNREKKKAVNLSLFPSDYEQIKELAELERMSVSAYISTLIRIHVKKQENFIKEQERLIAEKDNILNR